MYYCMDCGAIFDEPATYTEKVGEYWGAPAWETFGKCPECGSTEYDEAEQCERCGEWVPETYDVMNMRVCDICRDDLEGV